MSYQYKVVPFIGKVKSGASPEEVSSQLTSLINQNATGGWEFYQLGSVDIEVQPGCLAGLLGGKTAFVSWDQIIFRKAS